MILFHETACSTLWWTTQFIGLEGQQGPHVMNGQGMPPSEPISRQIDQVMNSRIENQPNPLEALIHLPAG